MPNKDVKARASKAEELANQFDGKSTGIVTLYPSSGRVTAIAGTLDDKEIVELYDGSIHVASIDRKLLYKATVEANQPVQDKGITFIKMDYRYGVEFNYVIENSLIAKGKIDGLIFWIDGKALGGSSVQKV